MTGNTLLPYMAGRLLTMPERRLPELRALLDTRLRDAAETLGEAFDEVFDSAMRAFLMEGLGRAGAHEGTLWLIDEARTHLIPRFNSGPRAPEFVGKFRQPLSSGMISMVVATELPICENEVHKSQQQDRRLDRQLQLQTCAMLAVPLYYASDLRGVISGVQLRPADAVDDEAEPPGFSMQNLASLQHTATLLARLVEHRLLTLCLGMEMWG